VRCDHKASRPDAATTPGLPLNDLAPGLPLNGTGRRMAAVHERGQKSRSERQPSGSSARLELSRICQARHISSDQGFAYELNSGPSPGTGRGPRIGRRKTRLTRGDPLRNRTVDLLLTMDHQTVPVSAVEALSRQNASLRKRRRARISPPGRHLTRLPLLDIAARPFGNQTFAGRAPASKDCHHHSPSLRLIPKPRSESSRSRFGGLQSFQDL
jgi:hypothetical protein